MSESMSAQSDLWLAVQSHLIARQPKNSGYWKEVAPNSQGCTYCDESGGGALICCSGSGCRVRVHLHCALSLGSSLRLEDNLLLFSCDKHTTPITFCTCKSLQDQSPMTACDTCEDWFHNSCVGLSEAEAVSISLIVSPPRFPCSPIYLRLSLSLSSMI